MRIQHNTNRIMPAMTILLALAFAITLTFILSGFTDTPKNYDLKTETYVVQPGDILDEITDLYMAKNTYGKREFDEFKQGIKELNMDKYPDIRYGNIRAGERLQINYFVRKEVPTND